MTAVPGEVRVEDPLQEVQALQKDLKAFSRAVNKPLRDNISYPAFSVDATHSPRRVVLACQNPGDVAILDRLKAVRALPGKAQTAALVRQALALQDGNARIPSTPGTPPFPQRHVKGSAQQTPRQDQAALSAAQAPCTAADFQDQLYDASGAIDLTRVRLKINQHQQDLVAAGLQEPPEQPDLTVLDSAPQAAPASKLRWQSAAGSSKPIPKGTDYTLRQDSESISTMRVGNSCTSQQAILSALMQLASICLCLASFTAPCCCLRAHCHSCAVLCVIFHNSLVFLICSQHEKQDSRRQNWVQERNLWEDDLTVSTSQVSAKCKLHCNLLTSSHHASVACSLSMAGSAILGFLKGVQNKLRGHICSQMTPYTQISQ